MNIYLDNSATTAMAPEVIDAMVPYFALEMGNAQSVHSFGQRARAAVETARAQVAALISASPAEIVFLSGGTEADNLAIRGIAEAHQNRGRHIVTCTIEHPAVLATCEALERAGYEVTYLPVTPDGLIDLSGLRRAIRKDTILVSIMHANNEIGTIQPIGEISELISKLHATEDTAATLHTDAVQSVGKIPVDVHTLGIDLLSISAHKLHGPKGIGALYVKRGTRLAKLMYGGHHERDRRPGTENVPAIVGFGVAAEMARTSLDQRVVEIGGLRDYLERSIGDSISHARINGAVQSRLSSISNMSFQGVDGESLLIALDLKGIAVSTGSACSSGSLEPSHVLTALGLPREEIRGSLRFSLSAYTTAEEIDQTVTELGTCVKRLREMSPACEPYPEGESVIR